MRITKRTNIAMRVLMYCAANPGRLATKSQISDCCNMSENHLAQVINQLSQLGYLHTQRGRNGGVRLGKPAAQICVGDVFRSVDTHQPLAECFADVDNTCPLVNACRLRQALTDAAAAFYARLDRVTLDTLVCGNDALIGMLNVASCDRGRLPV